MNRFQEQDEVILDRQTGLMWTKNGALSDFSMTWNEAFERRGSRCRIQAAI